MSQSIQSSRTNDRNALLETLYEYIVLHITIILVRGTMDVMHYSALHDHAYSRRPDLPHFRQIPVSLYIPFEEDAFSSVQYTTPDLPTISSQWRTIAPQAVRVRRNTHPMTLWNDMLMENSKLSMSSPTPDVATPWSPVTCP